MFRSFAPEMPVLQQSPAEQMIRVWVAAVAAATAAAEAAVLVLAEAI